MSHPRRDKKNDRHAGVSDLHSKANTCRRCVRVPRRTAAVRLAEEPARAGEQSAAFTGVLPGEGRVTDRCRPLLAQPCLPAARPFATDDRVLAKRRQREFARPHTSRTGRVLCGDSASGVLRVGSEPCCCCCQPPRVPSLRAHLQRARVSGDPARPDRQRRLQTRVTRARDGRQDKHRDGKRDHQGATSQEAVSPLRPLPPRVRSSHQS